MGSSDGGITRCECWARRWTTCAYLLTFTRMSPTAHVGRSPGLGLLVILRSVMIANHYRWTHHKLWWVHTVSECIPCLVVHVRSLRSVQTMKPSVQSSFFSLFLFVPTAHEYRQQTTSCFTFDYVSSPCMNVSKDFISEDANTYKYIKFYEHSVLAYQNAKSCFWTW